MKKKVWLLSACMLATAGGTWTANAQEATSEAVQEVIDTMYVRASQFTPGPCMEVKGNEEGQIIRFQLLDREEIPYTQKTVRQEAVATAQAPQEPYFNVRYALPIPACYTPVEEGEMAGLDHGFYQHNHSAGMDVMPNGDVYAIYFSTPVGKAEADTSTTFVQARLRYGAEEWDLPELFFDTYDGNDQSAMLWRDGDRMWFFGGGRSISDYLPFRIAYSDDNGATWTFNHPQLDTIAVGFTAQPISNAFRNPANGDIYMAMDGKGAESFLWRSTDNGLSWHDMGGRTSTRHSTIVPLDDKGTLLAAGGKNANKDGWNPRNISRDWGETWEEPTASAIPPVGTAQRPCMIRLASGNLLIVGDSYIHKLRKDPPAGWEMGNDCYIGISSDNGETWKFRTFPVQLPQHHRVAHPSLGYVTLRQGDNGLIHVLTTTNYPNLHYEFNEAWVLSGEGETDLMNTGGKKKHYKEYYEDGQLKSKWTARITEGGRYLLDGKLTDFYPDGKREHKVRYDHGFKTGKEFFWREDGGLRSTWTRKDGVGVWTQYWPNGQKKVQSTWNLCPEPRDLPGRSFPGGYVADGPATHWNEQGQQVASYDFVDGVLSELASQMPQGAGIQNEGK